MQIICTLLQTDITTLAPRHSVFLKAGCSSCHQPTVSKHEVKFVHNETTTYSSFLTVLQMVNKLQLITGIWQLLWFLEFDTSVNESIHQHCLSTAHTVPCNTTSTTTTLLPTTSHFIRLNRSLYYTSKPKLGLKLRQTDTRLTDSFPWTTWVSWHQKS